MKACKKTTAVLLALLMLFSLGTVAFAADSGNWTPIPTSPEGLQNGDYYLDFTALLTQTVQHDAEVSQEDLAAMIAVYNGGTWFIDYDAMLLKGTIVIPAFMSDTGEDEITELTPDMATGLLSAYAGDILFEVGATWIPVAKSAEGLNDGDWYIDLTQTDDAELVSRLQRDEFAFYVNSNADSRLMKIKFVAGVSTYYLPLADSSVGFIFERCPIVQYTAPNTTNPSGGNPGAVSVWAKIVAFLQKIIDFFKSLFTR